MNDTSDILILKATIDELCSEKSEVSKRIETSFLETSKNLEEIISVSSNLMEQSRSIIEIATGTGEGKLEFGETFSTINEYLESISSTVSGVLDACKDTELVGDVLDEIVLLETRLMSTLQPLKTMRIFFQIESVDLPPKDRETFLAVVDDIKSLHEEAESITQNEFKNISASRSLVRNNMGDVQSEMGVFNEMISNESEDIRSTNVTLSREIVRNENVSVGLLDSSTRISELISQIVVAIQNDDIAAQKASHVIEVVEDISKKMMSWAQVGYDLSDHGIPQFIVTASKIQCAQIQSILSDYDQSARIISGICPKIADEVLSLDQESLSLREFSTLTTSADGVIQVLLDGLSVVQSLLVRMTSILTTSYDVISPLGDLSSEVNLILDNITEDLRVVTVNAKIKASKQSTQTGLNPLTENVGVISVETQRISSLIGEKLDAASLDLKSLVDRFADYKEKGNSLVDRFSAFQAETEQALHHVRDSAFEKILCLTKEADRVQVISNAFHKSSESGFSERGFYERLSASLDSIIHAVQGICGDEVDFENVQNEEIDRLGSNYTMEKEWENQKVALNSEEDAGLESFGSEDETEMIFF